LIGLTNPASIVSMIDTPVDRLERILDAAQTCLVKHGIRKTTMEDIAAEAGMSRPAVYQYVRGKQDAYRRLADRLYAQAYAQAQRAAAADGTLTQRLDGVLAARLGARNSELGAVAAEQHRGFEAAITELITATIMEAAPLEESRAREVAELVLALGRGLEAEPDRARLRNGVALLVAGLATLMDGASQ
jgi:TetR/AcrR family transcriptional regulator